jgi:hypothetical protein
MSESIIDKKLRILGPAPSQAEALRAVSAGLWSARDASAYRAATAAPSKKLRVSYAERVAGTVKR